MVTRTDFVTGDPGEAHALVREQHVGHQVHLHGGAENFQFRQLTLTAGPLVMDLQRNSLCVQMITDPLPVRYFGVVRGGRFQFRAGQDEAVLLHGDGFTYPPGGPLEFSWQALDVCLLRLPGAEIERAAAAATGIEEAGAGFTGLSAVSPAMSRYWSQAVATLQCGFSGPEPAMASPLILASAVQLAATVTLAVFPNTAYRASYIRDPVQVAPAAIRRAVAFIDAHAAEPVTLGDIARAARVSARALQFGFRQHLDQTPTAYLRRVRLTCAHQELSAADPATATVSQIARRWGWASPARFASAYRQVYGQPPSRTLRA